MSITRVGMNDGIIGKISQRTKNDTMVMVLNSLTILNDVRPAPVRKQSGKMFQVNIETINSAETVA